MAIPELRASYRHIDNWRNARAVVMVWFWTALLAYGGTHWGIVAAIAAFVLMGPMHARFAILTSQLIDSSSRRNG
jgi:hypothetical protein